VGLFRRRKDADHVIDLRKQAPVHKWGLPSPCPACGGRGYLDHIDPFRGIMYLHCVVCSATYEITKAEIDAQADASA
jgi:formate dehydrogenase maturation protein FdhE